MYDLINPQGEVVASNRDFRQTWLAALDHLSDIHLVGCHLNTIEDTAKFVCAGSLRTVYQIQPRRFDNA